MTSDASNCSRPLRQDILGHGPPGNDRNVAGLDRTEFKAIPGLDYRKRFEGAASTREKHISAVSDSVVTARPCFMFLIRRKQKGSRLTSPSQEDFALDSIDWTLFAAHTDAVSQLSEVNGRSLQVRQKQFEKESRYHRDMLIE